VIFINRRFYQQMEKMDADVFEFVFFDHLFHLFHLLIT